MTSMSIRITLMQYEIAGHSPFRGRQAYVRLTTQGRREVGGDVRGGVVVVRSPTVVVVELAVVIVSYYLI